MAAAYATAKTTAATPMPRLVRQPRVIRQTERDVFARVVAAAHGDDDVLAAVDGIRHRRAALRRGQQDRTHFLARRLVVRAQHRASRMLGRCRDLGIAHDDQRLRDNGADSPVLAGLRNVQPVEQRTVAHDVRRVAMWNLPRDLAAIEIDRRQQSVWRLHNWQPLDQRAARRRRSGGRRCATSGCGRTTLRRIGSAAEAWASGAWETGGWGGGATR